jgi:hypothetical protein
VIEGRNKDNRNIAMDNHIQNEHAETFKDKRMGLQIIMQLGALFCFKRIRGVLHLLSQNSPF